jgi:hypothetical protein
VTRASLQADLLAAHERAARLHARIRQLEKRLSEALGEQAWHQAGLGAPPDIHALNDTITQLEHQAADLRIQLSERDDELAAARAAPESPKSTGPSSASPATGPAPCCSSLYEIEMQVTNDFADPVGLAP